MALDLSFYSWDLIGRYVLGGLWFSVQLTIVATIGGVLLGTLLALMRISGKPLLMWPAAVYVNTMRSVPLVMVILWFFLRNMTPVLLTQTIILFQDVSLVYIISLPDFVTLASKVAQRDGRLVEMYVFVALVYFVLCLALSTLVRRLQRRMAIVR